MFVTEFRVTGAKVHEARLAALMQAHGTGRMLTFNVADFARYPDVEAIHPDNLSFPGDSVREPG